MASIAWCNDIHNANSGATLDNSGSALATGSSWYAAVIGSFTTLDWTWTWDGPNQAGGDFTTLPSNSNSPPSPEIFWLATYANSPTWDWTSGRVTITAIVDGVTSNTLEIIFTNGSGTVTWGPTSAPAPALYHTAGWFSPIRDSVADTTYSNNGTATEPGGVQIYKFGISDIDYATVEYSVVWTPVNFGDPSPLLAITETYVDFSVISKTDTPGSLHITILVDGVPSLNSLYLDFGPSRAAHWYPSQPSSDFSGSPLSGYAPLTVSFQEQCVDPVPYERTWNFGDGVTSTLTTPQHIYGVPGIYTVNLDVTRYVYGNANVNKVAYVTVLEPPAVIDPGAGPEDTTSGYTLTAKPRPRFFPG